MSAKTMSFPGKLAAIALAGLLAACSEPLSPDPEVNRQLEDLATAMEPFEDFDASQAAGYTFLFMDMCMEDQSSAQLGGMGFHYVNAALLDASVDVSTPEALLYETGDDGELQLVAVEYVIPRDAWTSQSPPTLFGRPFTLNAFDLWALHVWVWKDNPSGVFADWNPAVSC